MKPDLNEGFFFSLPQINLRQVVWRNKLTVTQHLNTSCQLPFLLSCFHPFSASGSSSCFYKQDVCTSFSNLPFLFLHCLLFSFLFLLSFLLSQVCRHRIRARTCIGFRDCRDSPPPSSPPTSASFLHSCSPLFALLLLWDDWQRNWNSVRWQYCAVTASGLLAARCYGGLCSSSSSSSSSSSTALLSWTPTVWI